MSGMAKHIKGIGYDSGEFRNQLDALAHQVIARGVVRIRIETVHLQYAACQDIHNVVSFKLDDIHLRLLFQRHIIIDQLAKGSQLFLVGQTTGKQQIGHFLKAEAFFLENGMRQVLKVVTAIEQFPRNRFQSATRNTLVAHHIAYLGQSHQHSRSVLVAQAALYIKLLEQFILDPGRFFQIFGQFINQIFLLHDMYVFVK